MTAAVIALVLATVVTGTVAWWVAVRTDEAWFLQVVRRVADGERLYRDVFFGAGPLPVWLAAGSVRLLRTQVVVTRSVLLGYGLLIWIAGVIVLGALDADAAWSVAFVVGAVALGGVQLSVRNHYGQLSILGATAAAAGVATGSWLVCGAGILLALGSKYSIGILTLLWALPLLAVKWTPPYAVRATVLVLAGLSLLAATMGPTGLGGFLDTAVRNKGGYLAAARVMPGSDLRARIRRTGPDAFRRIVGSLGAVTVVVVMLAGIVVALFAAIAGIAAGNAALLLATALIVTGLADAFPRADHDHVVGAMPPVLLGLTIVADWSGLPLAFAVATTGILLVVLAAGIAWVGIVARRSTFRRDLPHLRLLPVSAQQGVWPDATQAVRSIAGDTVFVLRPNAAFFYLSGGLENPTKYDYPLSPTFGPHGQAAVAARIASGDVEWTCYPGPLDGPLAPTVLEEAMSLMRPIADTEVGGLYRSTAEIGRGSGGRQVPNDQAEAR